MSLLNQKVLIHFYHSLEVKTTLVLFACYHMLLLSIKERRVQIKISEENPYPLLLHVFITSNKFVFTRKYF